MIFVVERNVVQAQFAFVCVCVCVCVCRMCKCVCEGRGVEVGGGDESADMQGNMYVNALYMRV